MIFLRLTGCILLCFMTGCSSLIAAKGEKFGQDFSGAIMESDDPIYIQQALPAYLLLLDSLVKSSEPPIMLLKASADLQSAYAGAFINDPIRSKGFHQKALNNAFRALCLDNKSYCDIKGLSIEQLTTILDKSTLEQVPLLYTVATTWAGWIQANSDDWTAIGDLARVRMILEKILLLDESYQQGSVHLYLGVLATILSPTLGGQPELGKQHFDKAWELSKQQNLMVKVYYAKNYARILFDRELHDKLLNEVLNADPHAGNLTLMNVLAQQQAKNLLQSADDYF